MKKNVLVQSISFLAWATLALGLAYPALVTVCAALAFPAKAGGSLLVMDGSVRGSLLLAQDFSGPGWFRARPSAGGYATVPSGASNLAATNPDISRERATNAASWATAAPGYPLPPDMATSSGSGLDPDISPEAALGQVDRVAAERGLDAAAKDALVAEIRAMASASEGPLGPPRVNVVQLNAALVDSTFRASAGSPAK